MLTRAVSYGEEGALGPPAMLGIVIVQFQVKLICNVMGLAAYGIGVDYITPTMEVMVVIDAARANLHSPHLGAKSSRREDRSIIRVRSDVDEASSRIPLTSPCLRLALVSTSSSLRFEGAGPSAAWGTGGSTRR